MNQLKHLVLVAFGALLFVGCDSDGFTQIGKGQGDISVQLDVNASLLSDADSRVEERGGIVIVSPEDLKLRLVSPDGSYTKEWASLSDLQDNPTVPVGTYKLEAYYGDSKSYGFESPYYYGSTNVKIKENATSTVGCTAVLSNAMLSVSYANALKDYLTSYSTEVVCSDGGTTIVYGADETRPAYVRSGEVNIYVNIEKPNGAKAKVLAATVTAKPRYHYHMTITVNNDNVGSGQLAISFDDELETEGVIIDLSDELINAAPPTITTDGFVSGSPVSVIAGEQSGNLFAFNIVAPGSLGKVILNTENPSLIHALWPEQMDLMEVSTQMQGELTSLGLEAKGLWKNPDKMAVVDFGRLIGNLTIPEDEENPSIKFTMTVIDKAGKTSEPAELIVTFSPVELIISNQRPFHFDDTSFTIDLEYNGSNAKNDVSFQYHNNRGTWSNLSVVSFVESEGAYEVTIATPDMEGSFTIRAAVQSKALYSNAIEIVPIYSENYSVHKADVWAKMVDIDVKEGEKIFNKYATVYVSTNGSSYTQANSEILDGKLRVTGLQPATHYYLKASLTSNVSDACEPVEFDTEAAAQLPNSNLDSWSRENGQTNYWWVEFPWSDESNKGWDTLNRLTTSEGGSKTSAFNRSGCSYCAFSGTRQTSDSRSGSAAIIETVGWGSGNTAGGYASTVNNITPGELYLGSYNGSANYGYAFASRPSELEFYYKYSPKNSSDYGLAIIEVKDEAGNTLASGEMQLHGTGAYTKGSIALSYATKGVKAASISVIFKSSGNSDCWTNNTTNLSHPSFGNLSDGRNVGSSLYIDDISLIY